MGFLPHIWKKNKPKPKSLLLARQRIITTIQLNNDFRRPSGQSWVQSRANWVVRSGCSGACPAAYWVSPRGDIPQPLWAPLPVPTHCLLENYFPCLPSEFPLLPHVCPIIIYSPCPALQILLSDDLVSYERTYPQHRYLAHIILCKEMSVANSVPDVLFSSTGNEKTSKRSVCTYEYKKVFPKSLCSLLWCFLTLWRLKI